MADERIAYVINHAAFFVSHRLPLAKGAKQNGFEVGLFTGQAGSLLMEEMAEGELANSSLPHKRTLFRSSGMNPIVELMGLVQLIWHLLKFRPSIIHCASPKGVLYGGIAARMIGVKGLVLAISGMGYAFTNNNGGGVARQLVKLIYKLVAHFAFGHKNAKIIVQNKDDYDLIVKSKLAKASAITLIPGSGVDMTLYADADYLTKEKIVLLPARMLQDKGVREFVGAARSLKDKIPEWRFILAGAAGYDNPSSIHESELLAWQNEGIIEWLGHVENMIPLYKMASIVCLPSYREGMPKVLLEAAAAGCAVITTDAIGCREAIVPNVTGDLVPIQDSNSLTERLGSLMKDPERQKRYGFAGRKRAIELFSIESVVDQTISIYRELLRT